MKIQDFTGGLSTRLRPQYIQQNEAAEYLNIDNSVGSLTAVASSMPTGIQVDRFAYFYNAEQEWLSSKTRRDYVEFQSTLYFTESGQRPKKYNGNLTSILGIVAPTAAPGVVATSVSSPVVQVRVTAGAVGDLPNEELFYRTVNFDGTYYSKAYDFTYNPQSLKGSPDDITASEQFGQLSLEPKDSVTNATSFTTSVTVEPTDGRNAALYRMYEGKWRFVHNITTTGPNPVDAVYDISANNELVEADVAPVAGDMQYVYTYYNSSDGTESAPSPVSELLEDTLGEVTVTTLVSSDLQADRKRIYRLGGFVTTFTLVAEVDNVDTTYVDKLKDTDLPGSLLTAQDNDVPPEGLQFLTEAYAILFGAFEDKMYFSEIGKPNSWPTLNFLQFDAPITGLAAVNNGMIVFTLYRAFIVLGSAPARFSQQLLSGDQGCISSASIQNVAGSAIWASTDGLCISNGGVPEVITKDKLGKLRLSPVDSLVFDEVYYVLEDDGVILAFDYSYGRVLKRLSLGVNSLTTGEDLFYGHSNGSLQLLLASVDTESMSYTSPRFIEGRTTEEKTYKKVYIYCKGDIIINIIINDVIVATKALSGENKYEMSIPQDNQRGNFIQFNITGTGEVYEYEYEVGRGLGHGG